MILWCRDRTTLMLETVFSSLDLGPGESRAYLALLEHGPLTAGNLAKKTGVPRPSVYGFLNRLTNKGAVTQTSKKGVKLFVAEKPEVIVRLFRNRIEELETSRLKFENLIPDLEKKIPLDFLNPRFEFFEGREGVQNVLKDMLLYSGISTFSFWPIKAMVDILSPDFFHYHNRVRIQNKVSVRALWPQNQVVNIKTHPYLGAGKEYLREIRVAPAGIDFSMGYWVYKNKAAFLSSNQESFGFIIESRELAEMLQAQFDLIWALSKPLPIKPQDMAPFIRELKRRD